jgi:hypothetical protein
MRNFGVIRSSQTGQVLRIAPNFDNNQAYLANPSGRYSEAMLKQYMEKADQQDVQLLRILCSALQSNSYFLPAYEASLQYLH